MAGDKTKALLSFLKETARIRQKRISAYRKDADKLLWFAELPRDLPQTWRDACRSAFVADNPAEIPTLWLEVRKKRKPLSPPLPEHLRDWVPQKFQDHPDDYIYKEPDELLDLLNEEITVLVEKRSSDPHAPPQEPRISVEQVAEVRRLKDYPQLEDAWLSYLENEWKPWAQEMRTWKQIEDLYEKVDFMRRRIEEAEERYELILAVGLLQWRDPTGTAVKRHLLTAPAEISLDAAPGVLTVGPAASFEKFRVELDMLELQDRPRLEGSDLEDRLEELDVQAWDNEKVAEILRIIANKARPDAQVYEDIWTPFDREDETFRVVYAPALVLRERRPTAYEELISRFLKAFEGKSIPSTTAPWERFVSEGEPLGSPCLGGPNDDFDLNNAGARLFFPLPTNDEQRRIAERLRARPYVLVKGPPGTGKSQAIANLICHLLATGERVLVTAHAPKALTVLRERLPADIRDLCVTALGSSREDYVLLEHSVRGILSRKNEWKGEAWARAEIDRLEKELCQLQNESAEVDRQLRECREAETHPHVLWAGYQGTAAQIARQVVKESDAYGWFPELTDDQNRCPLEPEDIVFLADVHAALTEAHLNELQLEIGTFSLPDPGEFAQAIDNLTAAERAAEAAQAGLPEEWLGALQQFSEENLNECNKFLKQLEEHAAWATRVLGNLAAEILKDLLVARYDRWDRLAQEVTDLIEWIYAARERAGTAPIDLPSNVDEAKLLADTRRRLEHFRKGGGAG